MRFSLFPDCAVCKCIADDGGWLDKKGWFWVCIECDDWIDELEKPKENNDD